MEDRGLTSLVTEIESAWNAHDMRRFAACFAADADFVNVGGWWWRGRDEIERMHTVLHQTIFRDSRMQMSLAAVREVGPELVVVHVKWRMTGYTVGGVRQTADDREGIWSWVIRHDDGRATIVSSHNTDTMEVPPTHPLAGL